MMIMSSKVVIWLKWLVTCWIIGQGLGQKQVDFSHFLATIHLANGHNTHEYPANAFHKLPMDQKNDDQEF